MEYPLNQSTWRRAGIDTMKAQKTALFVWVGQGVLAVAGGTWLVNIAPINASTAEVVWRSVVGGLCGLVVAIIAIFGWNLFWAPYKQRDEAWQRIRELENQLKKTGLFDILCQTTVLGLPINKLDNGSYQASVVSISPKPLQILHRGDLTKINRFTMSPLVLFIKKENEWETTTAIKLMPGNNPLASSRTRDLSWNAEDQSQWVLEGLPITLAKDESLTLPLIMISVNDGNEVGSRLDNGEACVLKMSFGIFTDKGSPLLPEQRISLTRSDIKIDIRTWPGEDIT